MFRIRSGLVAPLCLLIAVVGIAANLGPVPPGKKVSGSILTLPPPSAWDAPKAPPAK
jgi:hypothetical protein